jgi:hypothetical protein
MVCCAAPGVYEGVAHANAVSASDVTGEFCTSGKERDTGT